MGKRRCEEAPDTTATAEDTWWYACPDCFQAFTDPTRLRTHQWTSHKYKGLANLLIMRQSVELAPMVKLTRCFSSSNATEAERNDGQQDQNQSANPVDSAPHNCSHCPRQYRKLWRLKRHVLLVHSSDPTDGQHIPKNLMSEQEPSSLGVPASECSVKWEEEGPLPLDVDVGNEEEDGAGECASLEELEFVDEKPRFGLRLRPMPSKSPPIAADSDSDNELSGGDSEYEPAEPEYEGKAEAAADEESDGQQEEKDSNSASDSDSEAEFVRTRRRKRPKGTGTVPWFRRKDADGGWTAEYIRTRLICKICNKSQHDNYSLKRHMDSVHGTGRHDENLREECLKLVDNFAQECQNLQCSLCLTICPNFHKLKQHVLFNHKQHLYRADKGLPCHCLTCCKDTFLQPATSEGVSGAGRKWECKLCGVSLSEMGIGRHAKGLHPQHKMGPPEAAGFESDWRRAKRLLIQEELAGSQNPKKDKEKLQETCECDVCGKPCSSIASMKGHKISHNAHSVQCAECGKLFKSEADLKTHLRRTHSTVRNYKCGECDKSFKTRRDLKAHQIVHIQEKDVACPECPTKFKHGRQLAFHLRRAHLRLACRVCGRDFEGSLQRNRHEIEEHDFHGVPDASVLKCEHEGCGKKFPTAADLKRHEEIHADPHAHICEACGKGFKAQRHLARHQMTHLPREELPLSCEFLGCGKRFGYIKALTKHKRHVHEGVKKKAGRPVPCRVCGQEFRLKYTAVNHEIRVHNYRRGAGQFQECKTCGKTFSTNGALKIHELSHGDQRGIICETCGKGFKSKPNLEQHQMTHVPYEELPHVCDVCGKRFGWPKSVREHKQKQHALKATGTKKTTKAKQLFSETDGDIVDKLHIN